MMEQWIYNFKDMIQHCVRDLVEIQQERLEVEKEQTELLRRILEKME